MTGPRSAEGVRERWIAMGLSTRPVDKALCEKKLKSAYAYAGLEIPRTFHWFPSPASALIAIGALLADKSRAMHVSDGIRYQIHNQVLQDAIGAFDSRFSEKVGTGFGAEILSGVREQVVGRVRGVMLRQLADQLRRRTTSSIRCFQIAVGERVYQAATAMPREIVRNFESLEERAFDKMELAINTLQHCCWGWSEDYWLASYEASMRDLGIEPDQAVLNRFVSLVQVRENLSIFFPFADFVMCCENPLVLKRDERNRLHSSEGPALVYRDGWGVWAWHGMRVPKRVIEFPNEIKIPEVEGEENAEIRRVMIERMGWERFIREARLKPLHSDDWGTLYRKDLANDPEPLVLVKVTNSTPEPDGSYKDYVLRVHHELRPLMEGNLLGEPQKITALNAIASTFGLTGDEYKKVLVQT